MKNAEEQENRSRAASRLEMVGPWTRIGGQTEVSDSPASGYFGRWSNRMRGGMDVGGEERKGTMWVFGLSNLERGSACG